MSLYLDTFQQTAIRTGHRINYSTMTLDPIVQPWPAQVIMSSDGSAALNAEKQRKASSLAMGAASTVLTGGMGLDKEAKTTKKKLFGE